MNAHWWLASWLAGYREFGGRGQLLPADSRSLQVVEREGGGGSTALFSLSREREERQEQAEQSYLQMNEYYMLGTETETSSADSKSGHY
jgi:hypothetical protein